MTTNRRCIFCGGTPLTNEHVFPRWAHRLVTGSDPKGHAVIPDSYAFSEIGPALDLNGEIEVIDNKPGRLVVNAPHLQTKSVCAPCNNGWMSGLEAEAKPLISRLMQGQQVKASKEEASTLVRWAQKTCATLHQCGSADLTFISADVLRALKAGDPPPGQWHIRLARVTEANLHYYSHTPLMARIGKGEADATEATPASEWYEQTIGVQSMFSIGGVLFIVRYSPYEFMGPTSLDCDLRTDYQSPPVLHGDKATRILKPWNWPVFTGSDLQYWTLWAVAPKSGLVALFEQPDGSLAVDEVTSAMERRDIDYQAHESRPGVGAIFARTPKKRQAEVSFRRTSLGVDQVIDGPNDADPEES